MSRRRPYNRSIGTVPSIACWVSSAISAASSSPRRAASQSIPSIPVRVESTSKTTLRKGVTPGRSRAEEGDDGGRPDIRELQELPTELLTDRVIHRDRGQRFSSLPQPRL